MSTLTQVEYLGATLEIVLKERDEARRQRGQLEAALLTLVREYSVVNYTHARAVLAAIDKERAG